MIKKLSLIIILVITFGLTLVSGSNSAHADSSSVLKVQPVFNEIVVNPGQTITKNMTITNLSNIPLPIKGYARQFVASDDQGNADFPDNTDKNSVQMWFSLNTPDFILQPQATDTIVATITVPQDAEPGGHYATLFFESLIPKEILSQTSLSLASRIGSLFFFVVSGDIHKQGNLTNFTTPKFQQSGPVNFELKFANNGNVHLHPTSTITITNWRGKTVEQIHDDGQTVLPTNSRRWSVEWKPKFAIGYYRATVKTIAFPDAKAQESSVTFYVIPIGSSVEIILVLCVLLFIITRGKRRMKKAYLALRGR